MRKIDLALIVVRVMALCGVGWWCGYYFVYQAIHPDMTQYRILLEIWPQMIPMIIGSLLVALVEWLAQDTL